MKDLLTNKLKIMLNGVDISDDRIKRRLDVFWIKDAIDKDSESHIFQSPTERHEGSQSCRHPEVLKWACLNTSLDESDLVSKLPDHAQL